MTTRLAWALCASLSLAVAGCGDDGGGVTDTCGDNMVTGSEQCDDGNTASGDGCSATCRIESTGDVCGDDMVTGSEQCDDGNTADGDGCSATCQNENLAECGNGTVAAGEQCDDGNTTASDGCSATCTVEPGYVCSGAPSTCTMRDGSCAAPFEITLTDNMMGWHEGTAMGNTSSSTSQVAGAPCDAEPASGGGKDHIYQFTLTAPSDVVVATTDATMYDAVVRVLSAPCDLQTEVSEYGTADGCSDSDIGEEGLVFLALPAGTYYVVVDGYDTTDEGAYTLEVAARPTLCGNGMVDQLELCDDMDLMGGDGCDARCEVEDGYVCDTAEPSVCVPTVCGNNVLEPGEECDDGNTADGDRCSMMCTLEYDVLEVEPNDMTPQALTAGNHIIKGSLTAGDVDLFTFTLAADARVDLETYDQIDNASAYEGVGTLTQVDCDTDTVVFLFDGTGTPTDEMTALDGDDDDGDDTCSYFGPQDSDEDDVGDIADPNQGILPAGTYTIRVRHFSGTTGTASRYILDLKITSGSTAPVAPQPGDLVLNEVMTADNVADTNCDMSTTDTVDEFVELVNVSANTLDLAGVTIADGFGVRHTSPAGTTLPAGKAYVVWGGGTPMCAGVTYFATASTGSLGLNDTGDTVTVATGATTPVTLVAHTFPAGTTTKSFNLSPDVTGGTNYVLHDAVTGAMGTFSPGKRADGSAF